MSLMVLEMIAVDRINCKVVLTRIVQGSLYYYLDDTTKEFGVISVA